jgi:hypothetical protein
VYREYSEKYGEDNARFLMKRMEDWVQNYSNLTYVDLEFGDMSAFKRYARECAEWLDWKYEEIRGDSKLVRQFVSGDWPDSEFLIVPPGHTVFADVAQPSILRSKE